MKNLICIVFVFAANASALSIDQKIDLDKKIMNFSSFEDAKHSNVLDGKFYGGEKERFFENLRLVGNFSGLPEHCLIKGSIAGYQDGDALLFLHSLPIVTAKEFETNLHALKYMYATSIEMVIEFSKECKKDENFPDVVVIQQREESGRYAK